MIELPTLEAIAMTLHHSPGVQAVLVGSGLSREAGIMTGWEITLDLVKRLAALRGVGDQPDWELWYRGQYDEPPNYSKLLGMIAKTRNERQEILKSYIEPRDVEERRRPTKAHRAIAALVANGSIRVVITTNFDRLMETAIRDKGVEPNVLHSDDTIKGSVPLIHSRCTVIKVHGDYMDTRIKNTDDELGAYSTSMKRLLAEVFDSFGLIVAGWSADWDVALRDAILRTPNRRYPFYWAARSNPGQAASEVIEKRGGRIVEISDADRFFGDLENMLSAMKADMQPHPLSAEMAVTLGKRYCMDDRFRAEWAEFLHIEAEKIRGYVLSDSYSSSPGGFWASSEVLRRVCAICGRWGTVDANREMIRTLKGLVFNKSVGRAFYGYDTFPSIGAVICFIWGLAGAILSEDFTRIAAIARGKVFLNDSEKTLAEIVAFAYRELSNHQQIQAFGDMSGFFLERFRPESRDIALNHHQATELLDRAETIMAIVNSQRTIEAGKWENDFTKLPIGGYLWKSSGVVLERELKRIEDPIEGEIYYSSGLLTGNSDDQRDTFRKVRDEAAEIRSRYGAV